MSGNWRLKICVVSFTDSVGITLEFLHQQMGSLSTHRHQLLLVALIWCTVVTHSCCYFRTQTKLWPYRVRNTTVVFFASKSQMLKADPQFNSIGVVNRP